MELYVDIRKKLPGFTLDVSFKAGNDIVGLLGASGSGKSMTLRCIAGIDTPDEGRIVLNDRVLFDSEKRINLSIRKRRTGLLFQNYALFPHMTVEDNIRFGLFDMKKKEQDEKVAEVMGLIHLSGLEKRYPGQLSGGQQQRVALARALAVGPEALLLDEPFSALDDYLKSHLIKELIDSLADYNGVTLLVSHNMEEAYRICSKLVVLSDGVVAAEGNKEDIFRFPPTLAAARLTGCKNISSSRRLTTDTIEAVEWGCILKTDIGTVGDSHAAATIDIDKNASRDTDMDAGHSNDQKDGMEPCSGKDEGVVCHTEAHVGIRAHYIALAGENDKVNVLKCWPSFVNETQFRMTVYLNIGAPPVNKSDYHIQWEITKEKWQEICNKPVPWDVCLRPEKLMLISK